MRFGPSKPSADQSKMRSVQRQYSSSVSPFHAKTGTPAGLSTVPVGPTATAAAASSCVEKMLQLAQRTCAPRATSVSISTAVCTVMCSEPAMRAPLSGCCAPNSSRSAMRPGISFSARRSWWRPASASERSATSNSSGRTDAAGAATEVWLGIRPFSHVTAAAGDRALGQTRSVSCRTTTQPLGTESRSVWIAHRSCACGSSARPSGPTAAIWSA